MCAINCSMFLVCCEICVCTCSASLPRRKAERASVDMSSGSRSGTSSGRWAADDADDDDDDADDEEEDDEEEDEEEEDEEEDDDDDDETEAAGTTKAANEVA